MRDRNRHGSDAGSEKNYFTIDEVTTICQIYIVSTYRPSYCTGYYYHVYNRSSKGEVIFNSSKDFNTFRNTLLFYQLETPPIKFSLYKENPEKYLLNSKKLVDLVAVELMPTHFHFQLKQNIDDGIRMFIQRTTNSYAHYFNIKNNLRGPVFERHFKGVLMENDEQMLHVSRYIHINSVTAGIVKTPGEYRYSSYGFYINEKSENLFNVEPSIILDQFSSRQKYKEFVEDYIDYEKNFENYSNLYLDFSSDAGSE